MIHFKLGLTSCMKDATHQSMILYIIICSLLLKYITFVGSGLEEKYSPEIPELSRVAIMIALPQPPSFYFLCVLTYLQTSDTVV
jgi:hypothetical protein